VLIGLAVALGGRCGYRQSPQRMTPAMTRVLRGRGQRGGHALGGPQARTPRRNAVFKADTWGSRIYKDHKHPTRRNDLAVATLMAFDHACWYA